MMELNCQYHESEIIIFTYMHSSELKALAQNNLIPLYNQMKGGAIRNNTSKLLQPCRTLRSTVVFDQPKSQQFSSSPKILCHTDQEVNIFGEGHYKSQICKVNGRPAMSPGVSKRVNTSIKAQNYAPSPLKSQDTIIRNLKTPQNKPTNEFANRYQFYQLLDLENQSKMSLSSFQENFKALRFKKLGTKTEEEILNFKLEGSHLKGSQMKHKTTKQHSNNLYITQQNAQLTFSKPNEEKSNTVKTGNMTSRAHQQITKQKEEQNRRRKTNGRVNSASIRKHERKASAKDRQSIHMNIINIVEQKQIENRNQSKAPFNQMYNRFSRSQKSKIMDPEREQTMNPLQHESEKMPNLQRLIQLNDLKNSMLDNYELLKKMKKTSGSKTGRETNSVAQVKFKQRKSILKNYTFKKQGSSKIKQELVGSQEDFHVSGWNSSSQFERRQLIMLV